MTWVIGASSLFGYGAVISDVQVTFRTGQTVDLIQKAYPLGKFIVGGFAGSVMIGFRLLQNLGNKLRLPPEIAHSHAWEPAWVANEWAPIAKAIFQSAPAEERKLGAHFLLVGISPSEHMGAPEFPRVYVIRFSSPDFTPGFFRKDHVVCSIGSGAGIKEYKRAIKPLFDIRSNQIQAEVAGFSSWARTLACSMSNVIEAHPRNGISKHLNVFALRRGEIICTNNDETIFTPGETEPIVIEMPKIARSYGEFLAMSEQYKASASCASC